MKPFRVPSIPQRSISGVSFTVKREKGQKGKDVEKTLHNENMLSPKKTGYLLNLQHNGEG